MRKIFLFFILLFFLSCFPYVYFDRSKVLLKNVDVDETLCISEVELEEKGFDSVLTLWALRDQIINEEQAKRISDQYFKFIDSLETEFEIWHLAWAISNFYRYADDNVKKVLEDAYQDAKKRPERLKQFKKIANEHINGDKIYSGDIHDLGRYYAQTHIVVKGDKKYVQSFVDYLKFKEKEKKEQIKDKEEWLLKCKMLNK